MTRNLFVYRKCIDCTESNYYCCQPYVSQSKGHGFRSTTTGRGAFQCGRQVGSLRQHLEGVDKGQLGITDHHRVPNSLRRATCTGEEAKRAFLSSRATSSDTGRGLLSAGERSSNSSRQLTPTDRILFCSVPGPQEKWINETSNQPQSSQPVGGDPPLQDGGFDHSLGPAEAGRLVSKGGPEGCLPHGTSTSRPPMLPTVYRRRSRLPVHLPSLRASMCPMGLHQGDEGCGDPTPVLGDHLHRRHLSHVRVCSTGSTALGGVNSHPTMPGVHHQYREIGDDPSPGDRILGHDGEHQHSASQPPSRESEADLGRGHQNLQMTFLSARLFSHFLGKLSAATQAVPPAPLFYHCLQRDLQAALAGNNQDYDTSLSLSQAAQEELSWWREHLPRWNGKPLKRKLKQVTISSDASQMGWGAVCAETRTGGAWSIQEQAMHINSLELLAATLAVKAFQKEASGISVLLQLDNATAVAYINNMGGTVSNQLKDLAKELWMWALDRDITLSAQHIPGKSNTIADMESWTIRDRSDWMLCPRIFQAIKKEFGPLDVDLFASRLTFQIPRFFSWRPDPLAEALDAFQQDWSPLRGFANPPWCLIGRVLSHACRQEAQLVLVAPGWRGQTWYPVLLEMLWEFPRLIAPAQDLIRRPTGSRMEMVPQLAVWPVSGKDSLVAPFRKRLLGSCCSHGDLSQLSLMTHISRSGLAGVLKGVAIPFQDPPLM